MFDPFATADEVQRHLQQRVSTWMSPLSGWFVESCEFVFQLFSNLTKSPWIKQSLGEENPKTTDHTEAVILGYSVAGDVIKTHVSLVDNSVDKYSAGSHLVMCRHLTDTVSKSQVKNLDRLQRLPVLREQF